MPKKSPTDKAKATRSRSRENGQARKAQRIAEQNERAAANRLAGKPVKRRARPRTDNMRTCVRCHQRVIVAGSVCWCRSIERH